MLALVERVSAGDELVVEENVIVLAIEPTGFYLLVDDARRDLQLGSRLEQQRDAGADPAAIVDVVLFVRTDEIDEAAEMRAVADDAKCRGRPRGTLIAPLSE